MHEVRLARIKVKMKQSKYIKEKHKLKRLLENKLNKDYYGNCMLDRLVRLELSLFQCKDCVFKDGVGIFMCSNRLGLFKRELI